MGTTDCDDRTVMLAHPSEGAEKCKGGGVPHPNRQELERERENPLVVVPIKPLL